MDNFVDNRIGGGGILLEINIVYSLSYAGLRSQREIKYEKNVES